MVLLFWIGWTLYDVPMLDIIPPNILAQGQTQTMPKPDLASKTPEQAALIERGRYLFTVAWCALCHNNDGSGGLKISWKPMGTLWVRNITSDSETGIGAWSEAEIAPAIRSGVSRNGYPLHWQEMIW